ncbi:MAG TPA: hypothetical protein VKR41_10465 [Puia sp.]|nr:hypothetical protein [Puia sp.]
MKSICRIVVVGSSPYAFSDRDMVQVILRNLISNAIKFCRPGDSVTAI